MSNKMPNFLVVGAAKCGTSSLHRYLGQHADIFLPDIKEPRFISSQVTRFPLAGPGDDKVEAWYVKNYEDYVNLFNGADGHTAVGEASADTLYFYKDTIPVIKQYLGDPKIIIMLRHPVKRAFSAYQHLVRDLREELSFEEGLKEEPRRIRDNWELIYHYTACSMYYDSVKAFMENFSSVKVILTDDQETRPKQTLRGVFRFLGVDPDFDVDTDIRYNISGKPKSQWIHQLLFNQNLARKIAKPIVRRLFKPETRVRIVQHIQEKNLKRLSINPETARHLQEYFKDDIAKLEVLLKRDLSNWKK